MRYIIAAFLTLFVTQAQAQAPTRLCFPTNGANCQEVTALNPFPVAATATITGFSSNNNFGSLTATGSSSASTALPGGGGTAVRISNTGTTAVSCTLATGAATGLISNIYVNAGSAVVRQVGTYDHIACIDQSGSVSNLVTLEGGSGLGNDSGGGGSGGGGAVSIASGAVASGAYAAGSLAAGAGFDGWNLTEGAKGDAKCASGTTACTIEARLAHIEDTSATTATNTGLAWPAGSAIGGGVFISQVTPGVTNNVAVSYGTVALIADPCQSATKVNFPISQATSTQLFAGTSAKKTYICSLALVANAAENVSLVTGTGSVCATGGTALIGSTTVANGLNLAANGGLTIGNGAGAIAFGGANADNVCLLQSGAVKLAGVLTYVQQ